eukprot:gene10830-13274_t
MAVDICAKCNDKVYFAERHQSEGKIYHNRCFQIVIKERKNPLLGHYPGDEDRIAGKLTTKKQLEEQQK